MNNSEMSQPPYSYSMLVDKTMKSGAQEQKIKTAFGVSKDKLPLKPEIHNRAANTSNLNKNANTANTVDTANTVSTVHTSNAANATCTSHTSNATSTVNAASTANAAHTAHAANADSNAISSHHNKSPKLKSRSIFNQVASMAASITASTTANLRPKPEDLSIST